MYASDILCGGLHCNSFKNPVLSYKNRQTKNWLASDIVNVFLQYISFSLTVLISFYEDYSLKPNKD